MKQKFLTAILATTFAAGGMSCSDADTGILEEAFALACAEGFILNADGDRCIEQVKLIIHGIVRDNFNQLPVAGASVVVNPCSTEPLTTDARGYFRLENACTTDDIIITVEADGYRFFANTYNEDELGIGAVVLDAIISIQRMDMTMDVSGTVYGGDQLLSGVTVKLWEDDENIYHTQTITTDANGRFTFTGVPVTQFTTDELDDWRVHAWPHDANADGIYDYTFTEITLGNIGRAATRNLSNIVFSMNEIRKQVEYTNIIGASLFSGSGTDTSGNYFYDPAGNILIHFGAPVRTGTALFWLAPYDDSNGTFGTPIPMTATWSNGDTVVTLDPATDFVADANDQTLYELRIQSLVWADGTIMISPNTVGTGGTARWWFDVTTNRSLLTGSTPSFYIGDEISNFQTVTSVNCDAGGCWLLDANNWPRDGRNDEFPYDNNGGLGNQFWNDSSGFDFMFPVVPGAVDYEFRIRQMNSNSSSNPNQGLGTLWFETSFGSLSTGPNDPTNVPTVIARGALTGGDADWDDFDYQGAGPLAFGNEIQVAVVAIDADGRESTIDNSQILSMTDTYPSGVQAAAFDGGDLGAYEERTDYGSTGLRQRFDIYFQEFMNPNFDPEIMLESGAITATTTAPASDVVWDPNGLIQGDNASFQANLPGVSFDVRGLCSEVMTDLTPNPDPTQNDQVFDVLNASRFANNDLLFFVDTAGGLLSGAPVSRATVMSLSGNTVTLTAGVDFAVSQGDIVCAAKASAGNSTTFTAPTTGTDNLATLADPSIFYMSQQALIIDTTNDMTAVVTIDELNTHSTGREALETRFNAVQATVWPAGTFIMPWVNGGGEYQLRSIGTDEELDLRTAVPNTTIADGSAFELEFEFASLDGADIMVGDVCMIDLDGNAEETIGDRYFHQITEIRMVTDDTGTATTDEQDAVLVFGPAPASFGSMNIPNGTIINHDSPDPNDPLVGGAYIVCLQDVVTISNAAAHQDTTGNMGLLPTNDQFAQCTTTGIQNCFTGENNSGSNVGDQIMRF